MSCLSIDLKVTIGLPFFSVTAVAVDQRAVQPVQRTVAGLVGGTGHQNGGNFLARVNVRVRADLYLDVRVNFLAQRPEWPFHAYRVVGSYLHGNAGRQVYR